MILEKLIQECLAHNRASQKELYLLYKDVLFHLSLKYCSSFSDAEDNLQDAFIEIFNNLKKYDNKGSFEGWMKRITINKAIDKYKKSIQNSDIPYLFVEEKEEEEAIDILDISVNEILQMIQNLPNQYRLVFNLYQLEGYSHKEIASLLAISESTSKSNFHRAKKILREEIHKSQKKKYKISKKA